MASFNPTPPPFPLSLPALTDWAYKQLQDLSKVISGPRDYLHLQPVGKEPEKYKPGQIFYADGVGWDPGLGEGPYIRTSTGWTKL